MFVSFDSFERELLATLVSVSTPRTTEPCVPMSLNNPVDERGARVTLLTYSDH